MVDDKTTVKLVVPGRPVPAQRMTYRSKWSERAQKSLDYQEEVAWQWKTTAGGKKLGGDLKVQAVFYFNDRRHGDVDNLLKSILDGLQYANAFENDKQVKAVRGRIRFEDEERVEVIIEGLGGKDKNELF